MENSSKLCGNISLSGGRVSTCTIVQFLVFLLPLVLFSYLQGVSKNIASRKFHNQRKPKNKFSVIAYRLRANRANNTLINIDPNAE